MLKFDSFLTTNFMSEKTDTLGGLTIFDIDDTLFKTTARVVVRKGKKLVKRLETGTYSKYRLKSGESFDFSEMRDAEKFNKESRPIKRMMAKAKIILKNALATKKSKVIIVTARQDMNNKKVFLDTFRKHGFDIDKVRVERAGKITDTPTPRAKAIIIHNYLKTGQFSRVRLFDDSSANLSEFLKLQRIFPEIKFEAFFANKDGSVRTIKEEYGAGEIGTTELVNKYKKDTPYSTSKGSFKTWKKIAKGVNRGKDGRTVQDAGSGHNPNGFGSL